MKYPYLKYTTTFMLLMALASVAGTSRSEQAASERPITEASEAWQERLEEAPFILLSDPDRVFNSLEQLKDDGEVHLVFRKTQDKSSLSLEVKTDGESPLSIPLQNHSSFASANNRLFVAEYETDSPGCVIKAYDLKTGEHLWTTKSSQSRPAGASAYRNEANIVAVRAADFTLRRIEGDYVVLTGKESYCDYREVFDAATGESIVIKEYRVGF